MLNHILKLGKKKTKLLKKTVFLSKTLLSKTVFKITVFEKKKKIVFKITVIKFYYSEKMANFDNANAKIWLFVKRLPTLIIPL